VFFRGEYAKPHAIFERALAEARDGGLLDLKGSELKIATVQSGGAYICGEETALINAIEGRRGQPRIRPPYPAISGLFALPTIVNNVETLSSLPFIIREGADAYAAIGTEKSKGTKLISASGHINNPGVYEVDMGTPLAAFLAVECGGTLDERALKAIIPGGPSVPVLTAREALGVKLDYESMQAAGSQLGSGGFVVCDETACMPEVLADITRFFAHESCGQCTPCREGSGWLNKVCTRVARGEGREGDVELLHSVAASLPGRTICTFADALAAAVVSFVTKFKSEFQDAIRNT
jgi:NADH-quinone oxidoreductase subunit F